MLIAAGATPGPIPPRRILYDANDERIGTMLPGLHRWTIRDFTGQIVREFSGYGGNLNLIWSWEQDHIRGEGQLVAGETPVWSHQAAAGSFSWGGKRHYHLDHLGSVRVVTTQ